MWVREDDGFFLYEPLIGADSAALVARNDYFDPQYYNSDKPALRNCICIPCRNREEEVAGVLIFWKCDCKWPFGFPYFSY